VLHLSGDIATHAAGAVEVEIGGRQCATFDAQGNFLSTSLARELPLSRGDDVICSVPDIEAGIYNVSLVVQDDGRALADASASETATLPRLFQYEQVAVMTALSPPTVSAGGNAVLSITGSAFSNRPGANAVTVGGFPCPLVFYSTSLLRCTFPDFSRAVDFSTVCPARDAGDVLAKPSAGIGSALLGSRGVRLQTWSVADAVISAGGTPFRIPVDLPG
jgi:hypothetical protein